MNLFRNLFFGGITLAASLSLAQMRPVLPNETLTANQIAGYHLGVGSVFNIPLKTFAYLSEDPAKTHGHYKAKVLYWGPSIKALALQPCSAEYSLVGSKIILKNINCRAAEAAERSCDIAGRRISANYQRIGADRLELLEKGEMVISIDQVAISTDPEKKSKKQVVQYRAKSKAAIGSANGVISTIVPQLTENKLAELENIGGRVSSAAQIRNDVASRAPTECPRRSF